MGPWRSAWLVALALLGAAVHAPAQTVRATPDTAPSLPKLILPSQSTATFCRDGLHSVYLLIQRRPTLVLFWRADDAASVERAVPAMLALAGGLQGDLALLCVERSGLSYVDMLRFAARKHWLGGTAAWTCEVPSGAESLGTPSFVLTSVSHATVLAGDPLADVALGAAAQQVVEERRHGPADWPADARAAITALSEGRLGDAQALAGGLTGASGGPVSSAATTAIATVSRLVTEDFTLQLSWNTEMLHLGLGAAARPRAEALAKSLASLPRDDTWRKGAEGELEIYTCGDQNKELKASAEMLELQEQLLAKGPSTALCKALQKCAKAHAGTHAAERAAFLATIAGP